MALLKLVYVCKLTSHINYDRLAWAYLLMAYIIECCDD